MDPRLTVVGGTGGGGTRFQPMHVDDVAESLAPAALGVRPRPLGSFLSEFGKHYNR